VTGVGKVTGSWLNGPGASHLDDANNLATAGANHYAGERLGLPAHGTGAVASVGRRLGALLIDWLIALFIGAAATRHALSDAQHPMNQLWPLLILALEYVLLVSTIGSTVGMRLLGIGVRRIQGGRVSPGWVVVRTALLLLVVPAVIYDRDLRGLHDKAADCVVVRI